MRSFAVVMFEPYILDGSPFMGKIHLFDATPDTEPMNPSVPTYSLAKAAANPLLMA